MASRLFAATAIALAAGASAPEAQRFNWDHIGADFCRLSAASDVPGLRPLVTPSLAQLIETAVTLSDGTPTRWMFQAYDSANTRCEPRTRNVALIEIRRTAPGGIAWSDYLVVVPERDGTTRIDDILFATNRRDTLRARLLAAHVSR